MNVNVSVHQIQHASFLGDVVDALEASGLDPKTLTLEITESVMMQNAASIAERLNELKQLGVRLAIDDFGTGYSSLSYLRQFPFDILKVDRAFIESDEARADQDLARAIIDLGRTTPARSRCRRYRTARPAGNPAGYGL
jgi:EAL domain-containing protein (putative c-di-GMP-specific phosphodiesterase class I)